MSEVPDKVIEQATRAAFMAGDDQEQYVHGFAPDDFEPWRWSSSELMSSSEATVAAAAPVIAAWAREEALRLPGQKPSSEDCPICGERCEITAHWRNAADYWYAVAEEWRERSEAARHQERKRIKQIIEDRAERAVAERKSEQSAYLSGRKDALVALAYELGQEATDGRS